MNNIRPNTIWIREYDDGDWEIGVLEQYSWGWLMDVGNFAYGFTLNLNNWQYVGDL